MIQHLEDLGLFECSLLLFRGNVCQIYLFYHPLLTRLSILNQIGSAIRPASKHFYSFVDVSLALMGLILRVIHVSIICIIKVIAYIRAYIRFRCKAKSTPTSSISKVTLPSARLKPVLYGQHHQHRVTSFAAPQRPPQYPLHCPNKKTLQRNKHNKIDALDRTHPIHRHHSHLLLLYLHIKLEPYEYPVGQCCRSPLFV
jgi:hypothetical protein